MKYLIVGLGNVGEEYEGTRHNIGFEILDSFSKKYKSDFIVDIGPGAGKNGGNIVFNDISEKILNTP